MLIIPAIDLRNGQVVRLRQGADNERIDFSRDPLAVARAWDAAGAQWIHIVDLDGAFAGAPQQLELVRRIKRSVDASIQLGGGLRRGQDVQAALEIGADRAVVGSAATDPERAKPLIDAFGDRLAIAIDSRDGSVCVSGWTESSAWLAIDLIQRLTDLGAARFIVTDVSRDGMLSGTNVDLMAMAVNSTDRPVISSGGVDSLDDLRMLSETSVEGAIVGMALYRNRFTLRDALAISRRS